MLVQLLKSKLHRACITTGDVDYEGSIEVPHDLMQVVGFIPGEKVLVASITTGARLETYVQQGPAGTGDIIINGGAAHLIKVGERVVIMSFASCDINEPYEAQRAILNEKNEVLSTSRGAVANK